MSIVEEAHRRYVVVDSSVSLKWALDDEEAVVQAVALRDAAVDGHFEMAAPSLWQYEVVNGVVSAVRRGRLAGDVGSKALANLLALGVRLADPEAEDVYDRAIRHTVAAHDAAYMALAATLQTELWTGDRRLYESVRATAPFVRWIGDYPAA